MLRRCDSIVFSLRKSVGGDLAVRLAVGDELGDLAARAWSATRRRSRRPPPGRAPRRARRACAARGASRRARAREPQRVELGLGLAQRRDRRRRARPPPRARGPRRPRAKAACSARADARRRRRPTPAAARAASAASPRASSTAARARAARARRGRCRPSSRGVLLGAARRRPRRPSTSPERELDEREDLPVEAALDRDLVLELVAAERAHHLARALDLAGLEARDRRAASPGPPPADGHRAAGQPAADPRALLARGDRAVEVAGEVARPAELEQRPEEVVRVGRQPRGLDRRLAQPRSPRRRRPCISNG